MPEHRLQRTRDAYPWRAPNENAAERLHVVLCTCLVITGGRRVLPIAGCPCHGYGVVLPSFTANVIEGDPH